MMLGLVFLSGTLGTLCVVLRSPNQGGRDGWRLPGGFGWVGIVLISVSFWAAWQALRPLTAVFVVTTLLMLTFCAVPVIGPAWRARYASPQRDKDHG